MEMRMIAFFSPVGGFFLRRCKIRKIPFFTKTRKLRKEVFLSAFYLAFFLLSVFSPVFLLSLLHVSFSISLWA